MGPRRIGDHEPLRVEVPALSVEGGEGLPRARPARRDAVAAHGVVVEGVDRLSRFEHHMVRDVHQVVDRPHPGGGQPLLHPAGRRAEFDILDQRQREAAAEIRILDLDEGPAGDRRARPLDPGVGRGQRRPGEGGDFAGHAEDRKGVGAIRRQVEHQHPVSQHLPQRGSRSAVAVEHQDAGVFGGQAEFRLRADHPGGHHPADPRFLQRPRLPAPGIGQHRPLGGESDGLSRRDIRRPADDGLAPGSTVHGHEDQPVGVRMGPDLEHPAQDHLLPGAADPLDPGDLKAGERQPVGECFDVLRQRDQAAEPAQGDPHEPSCLRTGRGNGDRSRRSGGCPGSRGAASQSARRRAPPRIRWSPRGRNPCGRGSRDAPSPLRESR